MVKENDTPRAEPARRKKASEEGGASARQLRQSIKDSLMQKMQEGKRETPAPEARPAPPPVDDSPVVVAPEAKRRLRRRVDQRSVSLFLRQLGILLSSGVPLARAMDLLVARTRQKELRNALANVRQDVERGDQLWVAMGRHPAVFNPTVVNVVRTGEESGSLVRVLSYLADYRDREDEMVRNVQRSITYPLFLLILAIGVVLILITAVIPFFGRQFAAAGVKLPWPTQVVLGISGILTNFWLVIIIVGGAGYLVYRKANQGGGMRVWLDRLRLSMPLFGRILTDIYVVQFSSMMTILMRAGLPMRRTLELVQNTMSNVLFHDAFADIRESVERGRTLQESFQRHAVFPPMVLDLIAVGEDAGTMPDVLEQVASVYQKEVDHETAIMGTLLEPTLIVGLGFVIGFIALATFLPYIQMFAVIVSK
jgi:type IV pilus assembly protein PilC